jgi:hypothetical protein
VKEIPERYGRRKLKTLWRYLTQQTNEQMLRSAMATRAGSLADESGWREFADSLSGKDSTGVETAPPPIVEAPRERVDDDEDWEAVDDG